MTIPKMTIKDLESFTKSHKGLTTLHLLLQLKTNTISKDQKKYLVLLDFYVFLAYGLEQTCYNNDRVYMLLYTMPYLRGI